MRILQVHWRYDAFGGGETYVRQLASLLEAEGHTVGLMTGVNRTDPAWLTPGREHALIAESGGIRSGLREMPRVLRRVEAAAPDLVHLHQSGGLLSPSIVKAIGRRYPTVKTVHDVGLVCPLGDELIKQCAGELCAYPFDHGCLLRGCYSLREKGVQPLLFALWERNAAQRLDRLLVSSKYMFRELMRNGFMPRQIAVLPMFTTMNRDGAVAASAAGQQRILFVGRLDRAKGGRELIDALGLIGSRGDWQVDVIGTGPLLGELRQRAADGALRGRVCFHGRVDADAMPSFYARARLAVVPSMIPESFGLVGIEAMACARPVVAFDSGGIRDWLADGETGFLVPRGDVRALAARIDRLLADDGLVATMGAAAARRVVCFYRPQAHLAGLAGLYESVIAERRSAGTVRP
jgi:glycosyltransferase involved in cell wall biosynthesis